MFGVKVHQRRDLIEGIVRALIVSGQNQGVLHDQASLDDILWPVAKYDVVCFHDIYSVLANNITCMFFFKIIDGPR